MLQFALRHIRNQYPTQGSTDRECSARASDRHQQTMKREREEKEITTTLPGLCPGFDAETEQAQLG